jgi:hypothetical protein
LAISVVLDLAAVATLRVAVCFSHCVVFAAAAAKQSQWQNVTKNVETLHIMCSSCRYIAVAAMIK